MIKQEKSLEAVRAEREYQYYKYHGRAYDDLNTSHDWISTITRCIQAANHKDFQQQMIKVASLAISASEWYEHEENK